MPVRNLNMLMLLCCKTFGKVICSSTMRCNIFLETAKANFKSHGVELNPWLVVYSKLNALKQGLSKDTKFFKRDLWKYDVSTYDNIVIFGVEQMVLTL